MAAKLHTYVPYMSRTYMGIYCIYVPHMNLLDQLCYHCIDQMSQKLRIYRFTYLNIPDTTLTLVNHLYTFWTPFRHCKDTFQTLFVHFLDSSDTLCKHPDTWYCHIYAKKQKFPSQFTCISYMPYLIGHLLG